MIDSTVHMMDAGMRLFETEKPFGTVLGGIKTEMAQFGRVLRTNEIDRDALPAAAADCDLFLDRSSRFKSRYITCKVEDAGIVGKTADGEDIHRYAASLKEGNKNTNVGIYVAAALIIIWGMLGWFISEGNGLIVIIFLLVGLFGAWIQLRPDKGSVKIVNQLLDTFADGK